MGIFGGIMSSIGKLIGGISLQDATRSAPDNMGCYKIFLGGRLMYVGKAEDGIRKRFVQYYNGTTAHYPSAQKIFDNRDKITVSWIELPSREDCRRQEREWIDSLSPEWNAVRGWSD